MTKIVDNSNVAIQLYLGKSDLPLASSIPNYSQSLINKGQNSISNQNQVGLLAALGENRDARLKEAAMNQVQMDANYGDSMQYYKASIHKLREAQFRNSERSHQEGGQPHSMEKNRRQTASYLVNYYSQQKISRLSDLNGSMDYNDEQYGASHSKFSMSRQHNGPINGVSTLHQSLGFKRPSLLQRDISDESEDERLLTPAQKKVMQRPFIVNKNTVHHHETSSKVYRRLGENANFISSNQNLSREKVDKYFLMNIEDHTEDVSYRIEDQDAKTDELTLNSSIQRYFLTNLCEVCFESSRSI